MLVVSWDTTARQQVGKLKISKFSAAVLDFFLTFFHHQYKKMYIRASTSVVLVVFILCSN